MKQNLNSKKVVAIFGPPGSGKGTQATLTAEKYNLFNLDTGKFLEKLLFDPKNFKNKEIQRERKNYESGILLTPEFVLKFISKKINELAREGEGIVFSGSPRTYFEAFGDRKNIGVVNILDKLYGKKNIFYFILDVSDNDSIKRNSARTICSVCGGQLLSILKMKFNVCPFCGGGLRKRKDDNPEIIKKRLVEFRERTMPVINELIKRGYKVNKIDGTVMPYKVFELISKRLNDSFKK